MNFVGLRTFGRQGVIASFLALVKAVYGALKWATVDALIHHTDGVILPQKVLCRELSLFEIRAFWDPCFAKMQSALQNKELPHEIWICDAQ